MAKKAKRKGSSGAGRKSTKAAVRGAAGKGRKSAAKRAERATSSAGKSRKAATRKPRAAARAAKTASLPHVPKGYHSLTPSIIVGDANAAIPFYQRALGAEEVTCMRSPDGGVMHAELRIGDSVFMLSGEWPDHGMKAPLPNHHSGGLHVYVENVDQAFQRAVEAGCQVAMPVMNMFWGDRYGKVVDPYGHVWGLATRIEDVSPEECARRAANWQP